MISESQKILIFFFIISELTIKGYYTAVNPACKLKMQSLEITPTVPLTLLLELD